MIQTGFASHLSVLRLASLAAVTVLAGCAGVNYVQQKYQGMPSVEFVAQSGSNYRIVDNVQESRLLIGPGLAGSATQNFVKGFSTGTGLGVTPPVVFRDAAEEYLKSTGKRCETRDVTLVVDPYYEVRYKCILRRARMSAGTVENLGPVAGPIADPKIVPNAGQNTGPSADQSTEKKTSQNTGQNTGMNF